MMDGNPCAVEAQLERRAVLRGGHLVAIAQFVDARAEGSPTRADDLRRAGPRQHHASPPEQAAADVGRRRDGPALVGRVRLEIILLTPSILVLPKLAALSAEPRMTSPMGITRQSCEN